MNAAGRMRPHWACYRCGAFYASRSGNGCKAGITPCCGIKMQPGGERCDGCGCFNSYPLEVGRSCRLCGVKIAKRAA